MPVNFFRSGVFFVVAILLTLLSACGGNSSITAVKTQSNTSTPALGATYNADVYVYAADGMTLLAQGKTSGSTGRSNLTLTGYTPGTPVIVKVVLDPANGVTYYDENRPDSVSVPPSSKFTMLSIFPFATPGQDLTANALTNMAAKFAGISADNLGKTKLSTPLVADKVYEGVAKTNLVLGLPTSTNILASVTPATQASPTPNGTLSNLLVSLATASFGDTQDPIQRAANLANAINSDGTIDTDKSSIFTGVNSALVDLGLNVVEPKITNHDINSSLSAAIAAARTSFASFTGSVTGGN